MRRNKRPNKTTLNYIIDLVMVPFFLAMAITGILKFPGLLSFLGISARRVRLPMELFTFIHDWTGVVFLLLVFVHIIQHFATSVKYFRGKIKKKKNH